MRLEPCDGKPSRTVLRGGNGGNAVSLPDKISDYHAFDGPRPYCVPTAQYSAALALPHGYHNDSTPVRLP
jgi:hypothetical protein